jgi:thioredoxin 1
LATIELTQENFDKTVAENNMVIIDFWAPWCGPCKSFGPIFEKVSELYPEIVFAKVNTEEQEALAGHFQIRSIPTTMILKEQILVFNQAGALPEEGLKDLMEQVKALDMDQVREEIKKQQKD